MDRIDLSDANVLIKAFGRAIASSKWKDSSQRADHDALSMISGLQDDIRSGKYKPQPMTEFVTQERGKTRLIHGNTIRDRVVRHALCDEVLMPAIKNFVVYDNSASQVGKGVDFARRRLKTHLHKYYRHHGHIGYALLIDFSKYYDNILHGEAYRQLVIKAPDPQHRKLLEAIIDSFKVDVSYLSEDEFRRVNETLFNSLEYQNISDDQKTGKKWMRKSIPIGDQTSQIVGVFYPHRLDNYCKIVRSMKYYGRYMDDVYVIHEDKQFLHNLLEDIERIATGLGMHINHKKTQIVRIDKPFHFLQNSYYLTETGRVVEKINKKRLTAMRRKMKKLSEKVNAGERNKEDIENMYRSWIGSYKKVMSRQQLDGMNQLYSQLFEGV